MRKKALITGITGQDGSYLAEFLLAREYEVHGLVRRSSSPNYQRIAAIQDQITLHEGDVTDAAAMVALMLFVQPDEVYNFAAQSHVYTSFKGAGYTAGATALGALNMLEAVRIAVPKARVYQASSSEMFGKVQQTPQNEKTPFYPRSPYGVAKVFGHQMAVNYRESYGIFACSGILFNHESPRRSPEFVTRKVTQAAAQIALGCRDFVPLGNLDAKRDWGFAGDYVEAAWRMLQQETPDDYVIATGHQYSVRELCKLAFDCVGLNWESHVKIDPHFCRPAEVDTLLGDASKAKSALGWEPKTDFKALIKMMVDADITESSLSLPRATNQSGNLAPRQG